MKTTNLKRVAQLLCCTALLGSISCSTEEISLEEQQQETPQRAAKILPSNTIRVSANGDDGNKPSNTLDGNLGTRWSSFGKTGKYITYDLGSSKKIDDVKIAFFKGNKRKAYFQIRVGNSTGSLTTVLDRKNSGSSGKTTGLENYNIDDVFARYVRISSFGNSSNNWNSITEVQINVLDDGNGNNGTPNNPQPPVTNPQPQPSSNSNSPAGNLGGLRNWKLNGYSGNLNVGSSNNGLSYVDNTPNLSNFSNNNWFYLSNGYTYFKAYTGNPTSRGSGNPRSELRELTSNGSGNINWDGTTGKIHRMQWKVRVDRLPASGKVAFGQIHAKSGSKFDDVIRTQYQGKGGQTNGNVTLRVNGYVTEEIEGSGRSVGTYQLGREYFFELTFQNSIVKFNLLNNDGSVNKNIFTSKRVASNGNYFKAGCYLQSSKGKKAKDSNDFGLVGIKSLQVFH